MARVPIALELYSVRVDLKNDPRGTLQRVAAMGYEGVEFAGFPLPAEELRSIIDEVGLVACSSHTGIDQVQDNTLDQTIAFNKIIGNNSLIIPGLPGHWTGSKENWLKTAGFFNALAEKLAKHGMWTGYHNHHTEFTPIDGAETAWDVFFGNTSAAVVTQLDTGNALCGGGDSVQLLSKYPGRARSIHLKPYSESAGKVSHEEGFKPIIGEDDIPWSSVFNICETIGKTEWYIVEYESDAYPSMEAVERCLKALKAMGK